MSDASLFSHFYAYWKCVIFSNIVYEAIVVAAYMMLLIESFAATTYGAPDQDALWRKDKQKLPLPVSFECRLIIVS